MENWPNWASEAFLILSFLLLQAVSHVFLSQVVILQKPEPGFLGGFPLRVHELVRAGALPYKMVTRGLVVSHRGFLFLWNMSSTTRREWRAVDNPKNRTDVGIRFTSCHILQLKLAFLKENNPVGSIKFFWFSLFVEVLWLFSASSKVKTLFTSHVWGQHWSFPALWSHSSASD